MRRRQSVSDGFGVWGGGGGDGLCCEIGGEARGKGVGLDAEGGEADAVDRDAVAGVQTRGECGRGDGDPGCACGGSDGEKGAGGFNEAGEHSPTLSDSRGGWRLEVASVEDVRWTKDLRLVEEFDGGVRREARRGQEPVQASEVPASPGSHLCAASRFGVS